MRKEKRPGYLLVAGAFVLQVCPAWAMAWRWKSSEELVAATQVNRKVPTARGALKEAG